MSDATAIRDPRVGTVVQDRYRLLQRLAAGGMGVVYRGERVGLGRKVAVKFLHPWVAEDASFKLRFELEAQVMGRLNHPTCVSVIDWGIEGDAPFLVMDHVEGITLRLVLREGRLAPRRALELVRQILTGLAHAHAQGVVHRDLKPDNIMLTEMDGLGELVRILDFGLAKLKDAATSLSMGMVLGTPNYMPPEQVRAEGVDERSDLYAVGAVLFEVLTGGAPFNAGSSSEILRRQLHEAPPRLSAAVPGAGFSEALEAVVARALAKSPASRFQSATEFAKALEATPEATLAPSDAAWRASGSDALPAPGGLEATSASVAPAAAAMGAEVALEEDAALARTHVSSSSGRVPSPEPDALPGLHAERDATPWSGGAAEDLGAGDGPTRTRSMRRSGQGLPEGLAGARGPVVISDVGADAAPGSARTGTRGGLGVKWVAGALVVGGLVAGVGLLRGRSGAGAELTPIEAPSPGAARTPMETERAEAPTRSVEVRASESLLEDASHLGEAEPAVAARPDESEESVALAAFAKLSKAGRRDRALRGLSAYRKAHPESAAAARLEGQLNFDHLRWEDGLEAYAAALRLEPGLREDRELIADVIGCLVSDHAHRSCGRFLVKQVGEPALPQLEEAAREFRYANVQHRARRLVQGGGFRAR